MGKSIKDIGRKADKKREHLKSMPYETTPAQRLMREEMEAGLHKASSSLGAVNPPSHDMDSSIVSGGRSTVIPVSTEFESLMGPVSEDSGVTELAYQVINYHGEVLVLGFREWAIIQRMVEAGVRAGHDAGMGTGLG